MTTTFRTPETEIADHCGRVAEMSERVTAECGRQVAKWGVQQHPAGTGRAADLDNARRAKALTDRHAETGDLTWRDILLEEVYEALAEPETSEAAEALVNELVQSAAVAVSAAVDIERRFGL